VKQSNLEYMDEQPQHKLRRRVEDHRLEVLEAGVRHPHGLEGMNRGASEHG